MRAAISRSRELSGNGRAVATMAGVRNPPPAFGQSGCAGGRFGAAPALAVPVVHEGGLRGGVGRRQQHSGPLELLAGHVEGGAVSVRPVRPHDGRTTAPAVPCTRPASELSLALTARSPNRAASCSASAATAYWA